ncbi:MAG: rubrerythrin family protein [Nitrospirae bacterium]|nr:rubrerythrin family protein [Nitrospirota bacterium]
MEITLINEHSIGVSKGTDVEDSVMMNFKGECTEVGLYLAMARQAQREGYPEVAETLKTIAWEEANHAGQFAEMNGLISHSTKENIEKMLAGEIGANKGKKESAKKARECNCDPAHDFFDESSRDEARHARMLKGLLDRFFKTC